MMTCCPHSPPTSHVNLFKLGGSFQYSWPHLVPFSFAYGSKTLVLPSVLAARGRFWWSFSLVLVGGDSCILLDFRVSLIFHLCRLWGEHDPAFEVPIDLYTTIKEAKPLGFWPSFGLWALRSSSPWPYRVQQRVGNDQHPSAGQSFSPSPRAPGSPGGLNWGSFII